MALLYHVTRTTNSKLIEREGFYPGSPFAESGLAAAIAEAEEAGGELEDFDVDEEGQAREYFNEFMDEARTKYPDKPSHSHANFFWSDIRDAEYAKHGLEAIHGRDSAKIDIIDTDYINCQFWSGNSKLAEKLFFECHSDINSAFACLQGEESECNDFDKIAEQYYADMKPWNGYPDSGREIVTSCHIPPSAIVEVIDPPGKKVIIPVNDPLNKQIAVAIPTETYYRDAYKGMATEAKLEGDTESANILDNISKDEEEHHELLESIQCKREPDKCQYGPQYETVKGDNLMEDKQTIQDVIDGNYSNPLELYEASAAKPLGESVAAEHFGRAICLGAQAENKPYNELTPDQQRCVTEVGMGWENAIVSRFEGRVPATSITENASLISNSTGQKVGSLNLNNGIVTVCFNTGNKEYPTPKCAEIGAGFDSFVSAQQMLDLQGIRVQPNR